MIVYKLTDKDGMTGTHFGDATPLQWGDDVTHSAAGDDFRLCADGVIHAYRDPILAVLMDPIHGGYGADSRLWECRIDGQRKILDDGLKLGARTLTTIREIEKPELTPEQRIYFAILCARLVLPRGRIPKWDRWADRWIDGTNRTRAAVAAADAAAWAAVNAARAAARDATAAAARDATADAARAAGAATRAAADDAARAAWAAADADAARAAWAAADADTARAAWAAAYAAADAARAAAWAAARAVDAKKIDFIALAHKAAEFEREGVNQ